MVLGGVLHNVGFKKCGGGYLRPVLDYKNPNLLGYGLGAPIG